MLKAMRQLAPARAQRKDPFLEINCATLKIELYLRRFVLPVLALLLATSGCNPSVARNDEALPLFDGVTTEFTLTRSQIRKEQQLEVRAIIRNTTNTTKVFRFLDFDVNARLYANGQLLEDRCEQGLDFPLQVITLKPGETSEGTTKVLTPLCYKLAPGQYSIRFNYNLKALEDESLRTDYEKKYGHPEGGIVPWDGRDHFFTVVE
jgi:hypothetical protein